MSANRKAVRKNVPHAAKSVLTVKADKKPRSGGEHYTVRTPDGMFSAKTSASSAKVMDKTVQRYAKALKRLADR